MDEELGRVLYNSTGLEIFLSIVDLGVTSLYTIQELEPLEVGKISNNNINPLPSSSTRLESGSLQESDIIHS